MFGAENANKLMEYWPKIRDFPYKSKDVRIDLVKHPVCSKDNDIHDFLTFIKLISTPRVTFENAIKSFIVYCDVS